MKHIQFARPRSSAGGLIGVVLAGSIAVGMPQRSSAQEQPAAAPVAAPDAAPAPVEKTPAAPEEKTPPTVPVEKTPPALVEQTQPAAPAASAVPAREPGPHVVLLLPTSFTEVQNAVSGLETIPDWTEAARKNLDEAAHDALQAAGGLRLEGLPALTPEESAILHDHIAVAQLIVGAGVQHKNGDWHQHRNSFDRSFGDGLHFLHERTGADYALLIDGTQVRQSGGRVAMKWLGVLAMAAAGVIVVPTGGGGEIVNVCLLDLNQGTVSWFNSSRAIDVVGSAGADLRNLEAAKAALMKLFASYPAIPALD